MIGNTRIDGDDNEIDDLPMEKNEKEDCKRVWKNNNLIITENS